MLLLIILLALLTFLYFYNTRTFNYWKKRGVKYEEPELFFGTNKSVYLGKQSRSKLIEEIYWKYPNEKFVGGFKSTTPELIIRDPDIIKNVLVSDFVYFYERGVNPNKKYFEPLRKHLFSIDGDMWRMLRHRLTPAFTSGKLKAMFPLIVERTESLRAQTLAAAQQKRSVDARDLMACYTTDIIGACGFGVDSNSLNDKNSAFRKLGADIFKVTTKDMIVMALKEFFPEMFRTLKTYGRLERDIFGLVQKIKKDRNFQPSGRNDFIDLLLEYQSKGKMEVMSIEKKNPDGSPIYVSAELDDELFAAQVFVFFGAGFETSSSSTSFTLHQLAYYPEKQRKVQDNIDRVLAKYDNALSYDSIKEMTYLTWAFQEGLRMFPSLGYLMRRCSKNYKFTDMDLPIDENTIVYVPVQALHMDPKYWDEPEEYRPERFDPDNFTSLQKSVYFPFGEGPRNCIGMRLGLMQSIAGLAAILSKFTVIPAPESVKHIEVNPKSHIVQGIKGTLPLMFIERKS